MRRDNRVTVFLSDEEYGEFLSDLDKYGNGASMGAYLRSSAMRHIQGHKGGEARELDDAMGRR